MTHESDSNLSTFPAAKSASLSRADVVRHLTYSVTGATLRLSEGTSKAAGYLELVHQDETPLAADLAVALRREVFIDAGILAHSLQQTVEVQASDAKRAWMVGRIPPKGQVGNEDLTPPGGSYVVEQPMRLSPEGLSEQAQEELLVFSADLCGEEPVTKNEGITAQCPVCEKGFDLFSRTNEHASCRENIQILITRAKHAITAMRYDVSPRTQVEAVNSLESILYDLDSLKVSP